MTSFNDVRKTLALQESTEEDRAGAYSKLTSLLKDAANSGSRDVSSALSTRHNSLTERILVDIASPACGQTAIQALGYLLYGPEYAEKFTKDQVNTAITGLCRVIGARSTPKNLCTRALWCLANQNFHGSQMAEHVSVVICTVTNVLVTQQQATPTMDNEAFNLFLKLEEQCGACFQEMAVTWYRAMVARLLFSRNNKLQKAALELVVKYEETLKTSSECRQWLVSTLKQQTIEVMISQLTKKNQDYPHILHTWSHFATVLGRVLHKRGSFLNELLRVVELGFKHACVEAQIVAYNCWIIMTSIFSQDTALMTKKCLKLLLMPLLGAAINERSMCVEEARLGAWWHLIVALGEGRKDHFHQVCIPFLMFCVGLNPKTEFSHLLSLASENKGSSHVVTVDADKNSVLGHGSPNNNKIVLRNKLLDLPRKGCGPQCAATPTLAMILSGCSAMLQFIGVHKVVPGSLVNNDLKLAPVFGGDVVPLDIALFMLLFLDCGSQYITKEMAAQCGVPLKELVVPMVTIVVKSVQEFASQCSQQNGSIIENRTGDSSDPVQSGCDCVEVLMQLIGCGSLELMLDYQDQQQLVSSLVTLPYQFLVGSGSGNLWKQLLNLIIGLSGKGKNQSAWISSNWVNIVVMVALKSASRNLSTFLYLSDQLPELAVVGLVGPTSLTMMWATLASAFSEFVTKTTSINHGTMLEPNFKAAIQILKFPFNFVLQQSDKNSLKNMVNVWEGLYEVSLLHATLVVGDSAQFPFLVASELYTSYSHLHPDEVQDKPDPAEQSSAFDAYQNSVATVILFIVSKLHWSNRSEKMTECILKVAEFISLLLKKLHEEWSKNSTFAPHMEVTFTIHDIINSLFLNIPTFDLIVRTLEVLVDPLQQLWEVLLELHTQLPGSKVYSKLVAVWSTITISLKSKSSVLLPTSLLQILLPLLVTTVTQRLRQLADISLGFWASTFSLIEGLTWPKEFVVALIKYSEAFNLQELEMGSKVVSISSLSMPTSSAGGESPSSSVEVGDGGVAVSDYVTDTEIDLGGDMDDVIVVHPHTSPRKQPVSLYRKSYLEQNGSAASPGKKVAMSPNARALDRVLNRLPEGERNSPGKKLDSVCRKLSLSRETPTSFVKITPLSPKMSQLLTEHQLERKQEERGYLPPSMCPQVPEVQVVMETQDDGAATSDVRDISENHGACAVVDVASLLPSNRSALTNETTPITMTTPMCNGVALVGSKSEPTSKLCIPLSPSPGSVSSGVDVGRGKLDPVRPSSHSGSHDSPLGVVSETSAAVSCKVSDGVVCTKLRKYTNPVTIIDVNSGAASSTLLDGASKPALATWCSSSMLRSAVSSSSHSINTPAATSTSPSTTSIHIPVISSSPIAVSSSHTPVPPVAPLALANALLTPNQSPHRLVLPSSSTEGILSYLQAVQLASPSLLPTAVSLPNLASVSKNESVSSWLSKLSAADLKVLVTHLSQFPQLWTSQVTPATVLKHLNAALSVSQTSPSSTISHATSPRQTIIAAAPGATPIPVVTATRISGILPPPTVVGSSGTSSTFNSAPVRITMLPNDVSVSNISLAIRDASSKSLVLGKRKKRSGGVTEGEEELTTKKSKKEDSKVKTSGQDGACGRRGVAVGGSVEALVNGMPKATVHNGSLELPQETSNSGDTGLAAFPCAGEVSEDKQDPREAVTPADNVDCFDEVVAGSSEDKVKLDSRGRVEEGTPELPVSMTPEQVPNRAICDKMKGISEESSQDSPSREDCMASNAADVKQATQSGEGGGEPCKGNGSSNMEEVCEESEDPLCDFAADGQGSLSSSPISARLAKDEEGDLMSSPAQQGTIMLADGDHTPQSCDADGKHQKGVLKRVSQFDTPTSAHQLSARKHVQFASETDVREVDCNNKGHKVTPIRTKGKSSRDYSSRRMLRMSPSGSNNLVKTPPLSSPVFPSLVNCVSPVDQILPSLSPSNTYSPGLVQLVRARNITTVGEMSSLTCKQVQTLPIKSPKVLTLKSALTAFSKKIALSAVSSKKLQSVKPRVAPESTSLPVTSASSSRGASSSPTSLSSPNSLRKRKKNVSVNAPSRAKVGGVKQQELCEDSFLMESDPDILSQPIVALETCSQAAMADDGRRDKGTDEDRSLTCDAMDEESLTREDDNHIPGIVEITAITFCDGHSKMECCEEIYGVDSGSKTLISGNEGCEVQGVGAGTEFVCAAGNNDDHIEETKTEFSIYGNEDKQLENAQTGTESPISGSGTDDLPNQSQELFSEETNLRMEGEEAGDQPLGETELQAVPYYEEATVDKPLSPVALAEMEDSSKSKGWRLKGVQNGGDKGMEQTDDGSLANRESNGSDDAPAVGHGELGRRSLASVEDAVEVLGSLEEGIKDENVCLSVPELCRILEALSSLNTTVCKKLRSQGH